MRMREERGEGAREETQMRGREERREKRREKI